MGAALVGRGKPARPALGLRVHTQGYVQIMHIRNAQHRHSLHTCDVHICDAPAGVDDTCMACALYKTHGNAEDALPQETLRSSEITGPRLWAASPWHVTPYAHCPYQSQLQSCPQATSL